MATIHLPMQVLAISDIETGQAKTGNKWFRRTFQVFDVTFQKAGNVQLFGDEEKLNSFKQGGMYNAVLGGRAGDYATMGYEIVDLVPANQPKAA